MRTLRDDNILKLSDGRQLCYAEYGDPKGFPIIFFHGQASSRLLCGLIPGSPFLPGVRLIAPDRPGYGQTDFKKGVTTLENWPNDVVALANALGIDKFAVLGASGGGPYALACAWKIPECLTGVGVCSSLGPLLPETMVFISFFILNSSLYGTYIIISSPSFMMIHSMPIFSTSLLNISASAGAAFFIHMKEAL